MVLYIQCQPTENNSTQALSSPLRLLTDFDSFMVISTQSSPCNAVTLTSRIYRTSMPLILYAKASPPCSWVDMSVRGAIVIDTLLIIATQLKSFETLSFFEVVDFVEEYSPSMKREELHAALVRRRSVGFQKGPRVFGV
jgi:hypothetical protein